MTNPPLTAVAQLVQQWKSEGFDSEQYARQLQAALRAAALPRPQEWQEIATAPKDGTEILLLEDRKVCNGSWNRGGSMHGPHWMGGLFRPTHWLPLPDSPSPDGRIARPQPSEVQGKEGPEDFPSRMVKESDPRSGLTASESQVIRATAEAIVRGHERLCEGVYDAVRPYCSAAPDGHPLCDACAALAASIEQALATRGRIARPQEEEPSLSLSEMRQFVGFLSAEIPELHTVDVPRLADVLTWFYETHVAAGRRIARPPEPDEA